MPGFLRPSKASPPSTLPGATSSSNGRNRSRSVSGSSVPVSSSNAVPARLSRRTSIAQRFLRLVSPASGVTVPNDPASDAADAATTGMLKSERTRRASIAVGSASNNLCPPNGELGAGWLAPQQQQQERQRRQQSPGGTEVDLLATPSNSLSSLSVSTLSLASPPTSSSVSTSAHGDAVADTGTHHSSSPGLFGTILTVVTEEGRRRPPDSDLRDSQLSPSGSSFRAASPAASLGAALGNFGSQLGRRRSSVLSSQSNTAPHLLAHLCEPTAPTSSVRLSGHPGDGVFGREERVVNQAGPWATVSQVDSTPQPKKRLPLRLRLDPSKRPPPLSSLALNLGPPVTHRRKSSTSSLMFRRLSAIFNPTSQSIAVPAQPAPSSVSTRITVPANPAGTAMSVTRGCSGADDNTPFCIRNLQLLGPKGAEQYLATKYERIQQNEYSRKNPSQTSSSAFAPKLLANPFNTVAASQHGECNRYNDVLPYEHSRVKLDSGKIYINASHLVALDPRIRYIATQGPLQSTQGAFWGMVNEQGSRVIVMLGREEENNRAKCYGYWPKRRDTPLVLLEQDLVVSLKSECTCAESGSIVRTLLLSSYSSSRTPRQVTQIQFTSWPDHGVPASPIILLRVIRLANSMQEGYIRHHGSAAYQSVDPYPGPMVIHCSAGVGRSGTFCVVDAALGMLGLPGYGIPPRPLTEAEAAELLNPRRPSNSSSDETSFDHVYELVEHFRLQRPLIVQTPEQFIYCYATVKQGWASSDRPSES